MPLLDNAHIVDNIHYMIQVMDAVNQYPAFDLTRFLFHFGIKAGLSQRSQVVDNVHDNVLAHLCARD
jgi:hypothetical protein